MVRVLILYIICNTVIIIVTVNGNCPGTVDGRSFNIILYCHYHSNSEFSLNRWWEFNIVYYMLYCHYHSDSEYRVTITHMHLHYICVHTCTQAYTDLLPQIWWICSHIVCFINQQIHWKWMLALLAYFANNRWAITTMGACF